MKKALIGLVLTGFLAFLLAPVLFVAAAPPPEPPETPLTDLETLFNTLGGLIGWLMMFVILVAVVMIIWAGFTFITASGDAEKTKKARNILTYALIGVAIVLAVRGLISITGNLIGVDPGSWLPW